MLNSIRVKFIRGEEIKYVSHLDLIKVFERALRRSKLPIAYSQGFNPHPRMVFGLPLPVGVTSEAEYADFELIEDMQPEEFMNSLNRQLPDGLRIVKACRRVSKKNIMASVTSASYKILACADRKQDAEKTKELIEQFLLCREINIGKETNGGMKEINIRPMIKSMNLEFSGIESILSAPEDCVNQFVRNYALILEKEAAYNTKCRSDMVMCFDIELSAGSGANLKPELLFKAFGGFCKINFDIAKIHRTGLFTGNKDGKSDPLSDAREYCG